MPQIIARLLALILPFLRIIWGWVAETAWPVILKFLNWTGIVAVGKYIVAFITLQIAGGVLDTAVRAVVVYMMLAAWALFLFVLFNFSMLDLIKETLSANPFADVQWLAGSLYLASHAFPFRFFFGCMFAYLVWRISLIHAALIFNRTVILIKAGVKF